MTVRAYYGRITPIYDTDEFVQCADCPCDAELWMEIDGRFLPLCQHCADTSEEV